jgi:PST family polysaccharide transporter
MTSNLGYKNIFKSTFLFGFVQVFNILIKIVLNKVAAIYLGAGGIGMIGLFQSAIAIIKTFSGMGIHQSAVKTVSEAKGVDVEANAERAITIVRKVVFWTALIGGAVAFILAPVLSQLAFESEDYTTPFMWLSLVVVFNVLTDGYLSILKGLRRLNDLAKASMLGALGGVIAGVPLYIFLGERGIVPALIAASFFTLLFAIYYLKKIKTKRVEISFKAIITESSDMVRMGFTLMIASFAALLTEFVIRSYISNVAGLEQVGFFHAGHVILTAYFVIIITALVTDYYPRISSINTQNELVQEELNKQIKVGFLLIGPLVILFILFLNLSLELLYSNEFLSSSEYIVFAVFGTLVTIASNPLDLVLIAKSEAKLFLIISLIYRVIEVGLLIFGYQLGGLSGLGIATTLVALLHFIIMFSVNKWRYEINIEWSTWKIILNIILLTFLSVITYRIESLALYTSGSVILLITSIMYSLSVMKKEMQIDVIRLGMGKLKK